MNILREPLADLLAGAYVVGTLRGAARRRFERLMGAHPLLQQRVTRWQQHLGHALPPAVVEPPAFVWERIARRLPSVAASSSTSGRTRPWRLRDWLWPAWAAMATAAALALAVVGVLRPHDPLGPTVAILQPAEPGLGGDVIVVTQPSPQKWQVIVPRQADPGPQRSWELWAVPQDGPPVSLGLAEAGRASPVRPVPGGLSYKALAISLEPAGGSPTGAPTGPVRYLAPWPPALPPAQNPA